MIIIIITELKKYQKRMKKKEMMLKQKAYTRNKNEKKLNYFINAKLR